MIPNTHRIAYTLPLQRERSNFVSCGDMGMSNALPDDAQLSLIMEYKWFP